MPSSLALAFTSARDNLGFGFVLLPFTVIESLPLPLANNLHSLQQYFFLFLLIVKVLPQYKHTALSWSEFLYFLYAFILFALVVISPHFSQYRNLFACLSGSFGCPQFLQRVKSWNGSYMPVCRALNALRTHCFEQYLCCPYFDSNSCLQYLHILFCISHHPIRAVCLSSGSFVNLPINCTLFIIVCPFYKIFNYFFCYIAFITATHHKLTASDNVYKAKYFGSSFFLANTTGIVYDARDIRQRRIVMYNFKLITYHFF